MTNTSDYISGLAATQVAICADDFGMDQAIDDAIVDLGSRGRLTATSVLVDAIDGPDAVDALEGLNLDVGLHLNFTEVLGCLRATDVMPLKRLIVSAQSRRLSSQWIQDNVARQLDRFESLFGRSPDYVDGHLHIHQLPQIRDALLMELASRDLPTGFWLRDTRAATAPYAAWSGRLKSWIIGHLGMEKLSRQASERGWFLNRWFYGVYNFAGEHQPFEQMILQWLKSAESGALVMTHPAKQAIAGDPIGESRVLEYEMLASDAFGDLLGELNVRLVRLSQVLSLLP